MLASKGSSPLLLIDLIDKIVTKSWLLEAVMSGIVSWYVTYGIEQLRAKGGISMEKILFLVLKISALCAIHEELV